MSDSSFQFSADMGFSHLEFSRALPTAVRPFTCTQQGLVYHCQDDAGKTVTISLGEEKVRRIASMALPYTALTLVAEGFNETEYETFLKGFRRNLQRGGG